MKETLIDIETYCEADIKKCGLYRYVSDPSFEILLIAWATDEGSGFGETKLADLASGDSFPQELLDDFKDSNVTLIAHNAAFERVSFSRYLQQHYPGQYLKPGTFLSPNNWICTMVMAASLTLPMALKDVGEVLRTTQQKDEEGKRLIKLFSAPCKPTKSNGGRTRNLPHHLPEDWAKFKYYCIQDVNTEVDIYKRLKRFPIKSAMAELGPNEVTNRTKIEPLAQQKLAESLNQKYGEGAVFINKVVINNMDFEEAYNTAIQQKSIAQQNADKQKIENEAAIAKAEADKQVAITNAEAEAQKTSIAADAQAEANCKIAESLSEPLIEYQKIQKWDGKLPTVSGSNALVSIDPAE